MTRNLATLINDYKQKVLPLFQGNVDFSKNWENHTLDSFTKLYEKTPLSFNRDYFAPGHFTASAFLLNPQKDSIVLTLHKKLGKWLQLGGHADGEYYLEKVALKEAQEESGVNLISPLYFSPIEDLNHQPIPIDFDIHEIPSSSKNPSHLHYDVRFAFVASQTKLTISSESNDLQWAPLNQISNFTKEKNILRCLWKLKLLMANKEVFS